MNKENALSKIQKRDTLNTVVHGPQVGPGNAYHLYEVYRNDTGDLLTTIQMQRGPRKEPDSIHGLLDEDLLEIVRNRLQGFQAGDYACRENAIALTKVEEALLWLNKRKDDRVERGVLDTYNR